MPQPARSPLPPLATLDVDWTVQPLTSSSLASSQVRGHATSSLASSSVGAGKAAPTTRQRWPRQHDKGTAGVDVSEGSPSGTAAETGAMRSHADEAQGYHPEYLKIGEAWRVGSPQESVKDPGELLRQGLATHDHALGLHTGRVLSSVREEMAKSSTLLNGEVMLDITTDPQGRIRFVRAVGGNGNTRELEELAQNLLARWKDHSVVPSGVKGWTLKMTVSVRVQLPSGRTSPGLSWEGPGFGAGQVEGSFGFDLADLGAKKTRVIHVRVLEQKRIENTP